MSLLVRALDLAEREDQPNEMITNRTTKTTRSEGGGFKLRLKQAQQGTLRDAFVAEVATGISPFLSVVIPFNMNRIEPLKTRRSEISKGVQETAFVLLHHQKRRV